MPKANRIIIDLEDGVLKSIRIDRRAGIRVGVRDFDAAGHPVANAVELKVGGVDELLLAVMTCRSLRGEEAKMMAENKLATISQVADALEKLKRQAIEALEAEDMTATTDAVAAYVLGWMDVKGR